jgi:hypothetical protein
MLACQFLIHLKTRVQVLEHKFVTQQLADELSNPFSFVPDTDLLAAYRLLVHAEIEDFLERKARSELDLVERTFFGKKQIIPTMWIYQLANHFSISLPHDCPFDDVRFRTATDTVVKRARETLASNNGIKTTIYLVVCLICGFSIERIDHTLGAALSTFGEARGDVAHKSTNRVTTIRAPSAEKKDVDDLVQAISLFFSLPAVATDVASGGPIATPLIVVQAIENSQPLTVPA